MRWQRLLLWSGLGLLTLIVAVISWLLLADLGSFKPQIERWASQKTGREVRIAGNLQIGLAARTSVIAEQLTVSNASWAEDPQLLSVGRVEVHLELASILSGPIVIELIDLDDTRVSLARQEDGTPNWALFSPGEDTDKSAQPSRGIHFQKIDIDDFALGYDAVASARSLRLDVAKATQRYRDDDFLDFTVDGTLNGREISMAGEAGSWSDLLRGENVRFELHARIDSFVFDAEGEIDDVLHPYRPQLSFTAVAPDVNDLLRAVGVTRQGDGDIDISGSLTPEQDGPLNLHLRGRVGRLEVDAQGRFSDLRNLEDVDLDVLASGEDVRPFLEAAGISEARPSPFMIKIDATRSGSLLTVNEADMVFGQAKLELAARLPEFPRIDDASVRLQIDGPDIERFRHVLKLPGGATGPFSVSATIDVAEDGYELFNVDIRTALGELRGNGRIGAAPEYHGSTLDFRLHSDSLAAIGSAYGIAGLPDEPTELSGAAEYGGNGIRTVSPLIANVHNAVIRVEGVVQPVKGIKGSDLAFTLQGPDLANLIGAFTDAGNVPALPYALDGQLAVRDDGYRFRGVSGKLGTSDLQLDGLLVPASGIAGSRFTLAAKGAAFNEIVGQLGETAVRPGPYELSGQVDFRPEQIDFSKIELTRANGSINLDLQLGLPVSARSAVFDLRASGPNLRSLLPEFKGFVASEQPFVVELDGSVDGSAWQFDVLDINVGQARLQADGLLNLAGQATASQFNIRVDVPDASALGTVNGRRLRAQRLGLSATLAGDGGELQAENLLAQLGDSDIRGNLEYSAGAVPRVVLRIESDAVDFAPLLEEQTAPPPELATALDDGRLIPDIGIPFEAMARMDGRFDIRIGQLRRNSVILNELAIRGELSGGRLDLADLRFRGQHGGLVARGYLDPRGGTGAAGVELVARGIAPGIGQFNQDQSMRGDFDIRLESTGNDLRSLLGNANGILYVNTRGGHMAKNRTLEALYGNALQEIIGVINPFSKTQDRTVFECVVLPVEINSGILTSNPNSLVATGNLQIVTNSRVDLKTEKLEVNIRTTPKQGISISAGEIVNPYIKVIGTLAAPRLAVDEKGVLLSGGAAVATGGLSILARAAWTRLARSKDPCAQTAADGLEVLAGRLPTLTVPPPVSQTQLPSDTSAQDE